MSSYVEEFDPSRPTEGHTEELESLAFEAEFDGVRRQVAPTEETLHDPSRYWDLAGSGTD